MQHLRDLINGNDSDSQSPSQASSGARRSRTKIEADEEDNYSDEENDGEGEEDPSSMPDLIQRTEESLAIDDAENPLQLLARASYIQPSPESWHGYSPQQIPLPANRGQGGEPEDELQAFFAPACGKLDVGDDIDPVKLGLVTDEEAQSLVNL